LVRIGHFRYWNSTMPSHNFTITNSGTTIAAMGQIVAIRQGLHR